MYLISVLISFPLSAVTLSCPKGPVERAGIILIKTYQDGTPYGTPCVIVGRNAKVRNVNLVNFPAGSCERKDRYTSVTAARETYEETGASLKYDPTQVSKMPYVYANRHQLFVKNTRASVTLLTQSVQSALRSSLPAAYKEVSQYYAVPIQNLLNAAKAVNGSRVNGRINQAVIVKRGLNRLKSGNGHNLVFDSHYLATIADDYYNAKRIFEYLTGRRFS